MSQGGAQNSSLPPSPDSPSSPNIIPQHNADNPIFVSTLSSSAPVDISSNSPRPESLPTTQSEDDPQTASNPGLDTDAPPGSLPSDSPLPEDEAVTAMSDSQSSTDGDPDWTSDGVDPDLRRVKVYELIGSRWTDRGTAFCTGEFDEPTQAARLIARSESNNSDVLLSCSIRATDVYQRQQDTLIVWTEPDGTDYALSFQDVEGCAEVWDFIVEVQRHLNGGRDDVLSSSPTPGPRPSITTQQIIQSGRLPNPQMGIIGEIEKAIRALARTPTAKERICEYIQHEDYVKAMLDVFHSAEESENLESLHALCSCMQTILLLNDHTMYEHILADELWLGVVGMLEYDPEFPTYKANYREFLTQTSRFLQPIIIQDAAIQRKIHQTYRLQYLKDVILARALDDSTFNVLNSCIIFNQIDIINHVQNDESFLKEVVGLFVGGNGEGCVKEKEKEKESEAMDVDQPEGKPVISNGVNATAADRGSSPSPGPQPAPPLSAEEEITRRKEVLLLVQQLCVIGKNVQLPARIALFRTLVDRGILYAVQWALARRERAMVSTAGEVLAVMLDHDTAGVRTHVMKQVHALETGGTTVDGAAKVGEKSKETAKAAIPAFKETIVQVLCRMLASSQDLALQNQLADSLRTLLDVPPVEPGGDPHHVVGVKLLSRISKDDPGTERFLDNFYKSSVETLFKPILNDVPEHKNLTEPILNLSREKANLYLYLCDLLCSFALQHSFRSHFFVLSSNIASRVASLLSVRDKHLCLASLRFFRICLKLNNRNLFNHLIKYDIMNPVLNLTIREARRDNLLSSTCQEFFEHMRKENMKDLINQVMTRREAAVRDLAKSALGAATFQGLVIRWEMNNEPPPKEDEKSQSTRTGTRRWGEGRLLEAEEEDYFNNDDEDEDYVVIPVPFARPPAPEPISLNNMHRRKRLRVSIGGGIGLPNRPGRSSFPPAQSPPSPLSSLLDYDEDDDTQSPGGGRQPDSPRVPHSPVLAHRQIHIPPSKPPEPSDPEDDILESLVTKGQAQPGPSSPSPARPPASAGGVMGKSGPGTPPMRQREKRRRPDDDDDELLERLASKSKRHSAGSAIEQPEPASKVGPTKTGDDGPKKLKLKFGTSSRAVAASPPTTSSSSRNSTKDGDEG